MARIAIGGPPNSGKTTAAQGSKSLKIVGLPPARTLYIVFGLKTEAPENIGDYRTYLHEESAGYTPVPTAPLPFNMLALTSATLSDVGSITNIINIAVINGISLYNRPAQPLENIVIDDYQAFLNDSFYGSDLDAFKALKKSGNHAIKLDTYFAKLDINQQKMAGYPLERRIDMFLMFHMKPMETSKKPSKGNPYQLHFAGKVMKDKYEIDGKFDTFLLLDEYKIYTKRSDAAPFIRIASGLIPEGQAVPATIPADLNIVKEWYNALYKLKFKK